MVMNKSQKAYRNNYNSVLRASTKQKMEKSEKQPIKSTFIYVEGNSDQKFYSKFVAANCTVECCEGKQNVIDHIKDSLGKKVEGCIGIVDRDYDGEPDVLKSRRIFSYDTIDLESFIIKNSQALDKFLELYAIDKESEKAKKILSKLSVSTFRQHILNIGKQIGILRKISKEKNYNLKFTDNDIEKIEEYKLGNFFFKDLSFDVKGYINFLLEKKKWGETRLKIKAKNELLSSQDEFELYYEWNLLRGHDITEIIEVIFDSSREININKRSAKLNRKFVEEIIASYFTSEDFEKTYICQNIVRLHDEKKGLIYLNKRFCPKKK